ncbi:hypothetical protein ASPCAL08109 [Aspergillus calidoustus]|uniref:Uncharacterized protein n=1 Tax=Aspergillus calidoustus TaxID=454130 RepID=A0A0U5GQQ0_ASPCI|nr:hypothetical protein ASPCAL08109 [Aspergillus calidoustus]
MARLPIATLVFPPLLISLPFTPFTAAQSTPSCSTSAWGTIPLRHEEFLATTNITSLNTEIIAPLVNAAVPNNTMSGDGFNASVTESVEMQYTLAPG